MVEETPRAIRYQRKIAVLAGAGMFIDGFDVSVIAVALPGLTREWDITDGLVLGLVASSVVDGCTCMTWPGSSSSAWRRH